MSFSQVLPSLFFSLTSYQTARVFMAA